MQTFKIDDIVRVTVSGREKLWHNHQFKAIPNGWVDRAQAKRLGYDPDILEQRTGQNPDYSPMQQWFVPDPVVMFIPQSVVIALNPAFRQQRPEAVIGDGELFEVEGYGIFQANAPQYNDWWELTKVDGIEDEPTHVQQIAAVLLAAIDEDPRSIAAQANVRDLARDLATAVLHGAV